MEKEWNQEKNKPQKEKVKHEEIDICTGKRWLNRARKLIELHNLSEAIKLTDANDMFLMQSYLSQRMLRTGIYDLSWRLSHPAVFSILKLPIVKYLVKAMDYSDRSLRKSLKYIEETTVEFLDVNYPTLDNRNHARTIELAINDLVVKSTKINASNTITKISITPEIISNWKNVWQDKINSPKI